MLSWAGFCVWKPFLHEIMANIFLTHPRSGGFRELRRFKVSRANGFIGASDVMQEVFARLERAAKSSAPVFITGESGSGKEVCARHLHANAQRPSAPFIAVNCAAIPHDLAESEFFGHARGAFTGAQQARKGLVELAHGGTLFLDEICEMEPGLQGKLLRFVETGRFRPVGAGAEQESKVRIICATNRDPQREVREARFRADLFWRLHVLPISLPPLRRRGADILLLASHFLGRFTREEGVPAKDFTKDAQELLLAHPWPGNVRELQNIMRQLAVFHQGERIAAADIAPLLPPVAGNDDAPLPAAAAGLRHLERQAIEAEIARQGGSIPLAARALGVAPSTLYRKRKSWNAA